MKRIIVLLLVAIMALGLVACATPAPAAEAPAAEATEAPAAEATEAPAAPALIKVGIVNNPPAESGYRAANVADFEKVFTEANGYAVSTFYSIKNDEQLNAAAQFITDGAAQAQDVNVLFGNNHELDSYALKPRHQLQPNAFDEPSAYVGIYKTSQSSPRPQEE